MKAEMKKDGRKGLEAIRARVQSVRDFGGKGIAVGVPRDEQATYPDGTPVKVVAATHEFGDETTPERPFLRPGMKDALDGAREIASESKGMDAGPTLEQMGMYSAAKVQEALRAVSDPPLSAETVRRKGSSTLLIDEGYLIQSITYVVRDKE